jgi:hypothetical protein
MRHPNYRLVKTTRTYTTEEIARLFGVHRNTARQWIKQGLPTCDQKRPVLVVGRDLSAFLKNRRLKSKRPCRPGELYCVRCRVPQAPAGGIADYVGDSHRLGNLIGICPVCDILMYRRVNPLKLGQVRGTLTVSGAEGERHIDESSHPSVNSDLRDGAAQ